VCAKLLADRADYALGSVGSASAERRAVRRIAESHSAFVDLVRECAKITGEPAVLAVSSFLEKEDCADLSLPLELDMRDVVTFRVGGALPIDLPSVRGFWAAACEPAVDKKQLRQCVICGRQRMPALRHPVAIKGVPRGQVSGMQIVSANEAAYESYGLRASLVVPTCHECAERYAQAANALLRSQATCVTAGPLAYIFWTREGAVLPIEKFLSGPDLAEVQELCKSTPRFRAGPAIDAEPFYCAALTANGGRIAVRNWLETTGAQVEGSLARYFRLQRLVGSDGSDQPPWDVFVLAAATVRDASHIDPQTVDLLLRVALNGGRVPAVLLYRALQRVRTSRKLTRPQAALIKMSLASRVSDHEGARMCELDLARDDPAYLCGRLLAVLERAQVSDVSVKATVANRFYSSASVAPLSVFPRLVRGGQGHLSRLHHAKPVVYDYIQRQMEEILAPLQQFPSVLDLTGQGLFALGYYHQRVANWRRNGASEAS
jgi:CRISPR-associated protein Csd1